MRSAPAPAENIRGRGASAAFGKAFTIFPASDGGAEHPKSASLGPGAMFAGGGSTSAVGLRAVEKAQLEELAAEAVRARERENGRNLVEALPSLIRACVEQESFHMSGIVGLRRSRVCGSAGRA